MIQDLTKDYLSFFLLIYYWLLFRKHTKACQFASDSLYKVYDSGDASTDI